MGTDMPDQKVAGQPSIGRSMLTILVESGRRESNPHDQLGRLVTHSGRPRPFAALTRIYDIPTALRRLFG
jgi:hypothetical protein